MSLTPFAAVIRLVSSYICTISHVFAVMSEKPPLRLEDIPVTYMTAYLLDKIRHYGDKVAMVDATTEKTTTYSELVTRIERAASGLQAIGVMKDDDIGVLSPNHPDYLVTFYACALTTWPKFSETATPSSCLPCLLFCPKYRKRHREAGGDYETFESLLDPGHAPYRTPELDPRTCAGLNSDKDTFVTFFPFFHALGLYMVCFVGHCLGARIVIMPRFDFETFLRLIEKYRPRNLQLVPPIMVLLAKSPKVSEYDLSSVSQIACGAAPLSKEIEDLVKEKLKLPCIFQGYGMTEVGVTHLNGRGELRYKSVGKLLPLTEMKIVDVETGKRVGPGQEGEIWIRGPQVCGGYLGLPEQTRELFTNDGWVKTGDIGYEDEDGYLFVVDRLKELIKYKAFQVAPATLEDILLRHDAIADVGVVGMPDVEAGELPRAYVVRKQGREASEEEIRKFVDDQVAPHMKLRGGVEFIQEIPRTASGKILRKSLRELARALAAKRPPA
ncbi:LUCI-like protein [Mya arenaria]|uniref:LUCI-like protein n=1 Tax=Mya arenaria TaxID=6604 RepID=A0ABY7DB89_MYAAR|nr:LUCI-like protein [Mya arenaria]